MVDERGIRRVAVIAAPPVSMFNLAIPELLFTKTEVDGRPGYDVLICAPEPGPVPTAGGLDLYVRHGLEVLRKADTVVVASRSNAAVTGLST